MDFSPENIRKHFHSLTAKSDKLRAEREPLSAELDAIVAGDTKLSVKAAQKREAELRTRIRSIQARMAPIEVERAAAARALGGQTGQPA